MIATDTIQKFCRLPVFLLFVAAGVLLACTGCVATDRVKADEQVEAPSSFDHSAFDRLLDGYVDERGLVDYERLKENKEVALRPYLEQLAATDPANLSVDEQLAFWLNAYNALTLKLIVDNYPTESIRRVTPVQVPGVTVMIPERGFFGSSVLPANDPFRIPVGYVGGQERTLNEIEHEIIRPQFVGTESYDEPRIHFALVCAAMSCPKLRGEAYTGQKLQAQLADQADTFLHDRSKNAIPAEGGAIQVSKIFDWFQGDFGGSPEAVQQFIAPYFDGDTARQLANGAFTVEYTDYDWTLNDQAKADEVPQTTPAPADAAAEK